MAIDFLIDSLQVSCILIPSISQYLHIHPHLPVFFFFFLRLSLNLDWTCLLGTYLFPPTPQLWVYQGAMLLCLGCFLFLMGSGDLTQVLILYQLSYLSSPFLVCVQPRLFESSWPFCCFSLSSAQVMRWVFLIQQKVKYKEILSWVWWHKHLVPALEKQRLEDWCNFEACLIYIASSKLSRGYTGRSRLRQSVLVDKMSNSFD